MFYVNAVAVVCTLPVLVTTPLPDMAIWPWLSGVSDIRPIGMYAGIVAVGQASASSLGPYTFLRRVIRRPEKGNLICEIPPPSLAGVVVIFAPRSAQRRCAR